MLKKTLVLLLCSVLILTGCSRKSSSTTIEPADQSATVPDNVPSETNTDTASDADGMSEEVSENDTRKPETVSLIMNRTNGNEKVSVTMTGLCQYEKLESDAYTDTPEDGNVFLVMFLEITNHDNGDDYINPEALSATVDGNELQHCVLFNQPESYEPIFDHIRPGERLTGFIVWQVPSDWKEFQMKYDGWADICGLTVTADVTPEILCDPPPLD